MNCPENYNSLQLCDIFQDFQKSRCPRIPTDKTCKCSRHVNSKQTLDRVRHVTLTTSEQRDDGYITDRSARIRNHSNMAGSGAYITWF